VSDYDRARNRSPGRKMAMSAAWRRASKLFLCEPGNQVCGHCRAAPATMVDHRVPHKGDAGLFWDRANWVASCGPCNSSKAAQTEAGFGNPAKPPSAFKRRIKGCDAQGYPLDPDHPWNRDR
jgi:5-methylcytosine-specific restriction enzyme A